MLHHRLQPGQLLKVDGEDDFVDDVVLQDAADRIERENIVAAKLARRRGADLGMDKAFSRSPSRGSLR